MLLLGIDLGTSSVKVSVIQANTLQLLASAQYPESESGIISPQPGWAEQDPETWWDHVQKAILKVHAQRKYDPKDIGAIGIAYQMHGLVCIDKDQQVLRNSIIWCDSRAVALGKEAFEKIGNEKCLKHLLNSPGNFTASKLAWVKQHEPAIYEKIVQVMLPGDFIAMKLTGQTTTTIAALSEGVFWDFKQNELSKDVFDHFGIDRSFIPVIQNVFTEHGNVLPVVASALALKTGIPVTYKAGDQPNNALSLNVLNPGEVAATAGTSGVIYAVSDQLTYDQQSRINSFAHVNHTENKKRIGVLLNINGTGILNRWIKEITGNNISYENINSISEKIKPGSEGIVILPFGNGAERMLGNKTIHAHIQNINFNIHQSAHLYRAAQEGIAFAFRYGLDIMRSNGIHPTVIRAGKTNMFLSKVFTQSFVNATQTPVELYNSDGSVGAATGAGIGASVFNTADAFKTFIPIQKIEPAQKDLYEELYNKWKATLLVQLNQEK